MSPFAPEILVLRDRFGSLVPRQPSHPDTQAESGAYFRDSPEFRGDVYLFIVIIAMQVHQNRGESTVYAEPKI